MGCQDLMIAQHFHKREFFTRWIEILMPQVSASSTEADMMWPDWQ
jgi:hypothetical protein